jgi:hypothetical protein
MRVATPQGKTLTAYFALTYLALAGNVAGYLRAAPPADWLGTAFAAAVCLTYTALYLAPLALVCTALLLATHRARLVAAVAVSGGALLQIWIFADRFLFGMYGFHLNGFVWNLVTTRGGLESMGGGRDTFASFALVVTAFALLQVALWLAADRTRIGTWLAPRSRRSPLALAALFLVLTVGERATYALSYAVHQSSVLAAADLFPFYLPTRARDLTRSLGIAAADDPMALEAAAGALDYPLHPVQRVAHPRYNVVWLVAESLRADALDPEIMPATTAFAAKSLRFTQHYSGGNNTRMGMFAMFYGLYGGYWFAFQDQERSPLLMDVLLDDGYQVDVRTSAKFTYPEFDETIFARIPRDQLHEGDGKPGWVNDRRNVGELLAFLKKRDRDRPFFAFMFFESPHARYEFPPESVVRTPYLDSLNYATMDLSRDIGLIKNRYLNAVHHLDSQLARVFAALEADGLLENTIVIVTGDHGEEFMEKGRWGHASAFSEEQTRVPLLLYVPGRAPGEVTRMTSHLDLPATLLPLFGVTNPSSDYSLGYDLLNGPGREFTVVSSWDALAYVDAHHKLQLPLGHFDFTMSRRVTARDDRALSAQEASNFADHSRVLDLLRDLTRFGRSRS